MPHALPVLCDHCRAVGVAGDASFAHLGGLLDFAPVPRKHDRVDGWNAERQRAFVAALSVTGSRRRAAAAVGKAQYGVDQLLAAPGSEGFRAACEAAMAIARATGKSRLDSGLNALAGEAAAWSPPPAPWSGAQTRGATSRSHLSARARWAEPEPEPEMSDEEKAELFERIVRRYLLKVAAERKARLAGRIVEADFYLRQLTFIEVMMDVGSGNGFQVLSEFREGGVGLVDIAETEFSRFLGEARRAWWAERADPPRPPHPPADRLETQGRFKTEPLEATTGGDKPSPEEQAKARRERYARDAEAQVEWEAEARRDYERRRDSVAESYTKSRARPASLREATELGRSRP